MDKLPRGLKYHQEDIKLGRIIPGTDSEPMITITGRGAYIRCRLISLAMDKDPFVYDESYSEGDLSEEEIDAIDSWLTNQLPMLLSDFGIKHYIRFLPDSKCYYDFIEETLYCADGEKPKKQGLINGEPYPVSYSEAAIIKEMTKAVNQPFLWNVFEDWSDKLHGEHSIDQTWSTFRKYDSSIKATFQKKNKKYSYIGAPQIWEIGEIKQGITLTFENIFNVTSYGKVIAFADRISHSFNAYTTDNAPITSVFLFLGMDKTVTGDFFLHVDLTKMAVGNCCGQDVLKILLSRFCINLNAVWNQLRNNLKENLMVSLNASAYYNEMEKLPSQNSDLSIYNNTDDRLERSLIRVCPKVRELIENTPAGIELFCYCDINVTPKSIIDYIVSLVLACFCYCQIDDNDDVFKLLMTKYKNELAVLIRERFGYNPPEGRNQSSLDQIIADLKVLESIDDPELRLPYLRIIKENTYKYLNDEINRLTQSPGGLNSKEK